MYIYFKGNCQRAYLMWQYKECILRLNCEVMFQPWSPLYLFPRPKEVLFLKSVLMKSKSTVCIMPTSKWRERKNTYCRFLTPNSENKVTFCWLLSRSFFVHGHSRNDSDNKRKKELLKWWIINSQWVNKELIGDTIAVERWPTMLKVACDLQSQTVTEIICNFTKRAGSISATVSVSTSLSFPYKYTHCSPICLNSPID